MMADDPLTPEDVLAFLVLSELDSDYSFQQFLNDRRKVVFSLKNATEIDSARWCELLSREIILSVWGGEKSPEEINAHTQVMN
ncbi:MAG: hypothetical protein ACE5I8_08390 [Thermodesulfobacteriota bacterium]